MFRRHLPAILLFAFLTILLTNPLIVHIWDAAQDKQDALLNTWIVAWVGHALITDPVNFFNTNIFYPYPNTLAFSEILLPQGLLALPLTLATNNPIFSYNLVLLAMLWLDAFAMYLLVYDLTRREEAAWIAGAIYAFNPFNLGNLAQLQLLALSWLPLALLFLGRLLSERHLPVVISSTRSQSAKADFVLLLERIRFALLFSLFFVLQSFSSFYYALLAGMAVSLYLVLWLWAERAHLLTSVRRVIVPLALSFGLIAISIAPFLMPYLAVQRELGFHRQVQESEPFSASLKQFVEVAPENVLYGRWLAPNPVVRVGGYPLDTLFPGIAALALAGIGLFSRRASSKSLFIILLIFSFVLALGPRLYLTHEQSTDINLPYRWLYDLLPPLRALRAPIRFDALINLALAALAGFGSAAFLSRFAQSQARLTALAVVGLIAVEYLALPAALTQTLPVADNIPGVYQWLAQQPLGVVLELPMMGPNAQGELDISTQYFTTYHWQKTPDGYSGFIPPRRGEIAYEMQFFPSPRSIALLRALDVIYLVDHASRDCLSSSALGDRFLPAEPNKIDDACVYRATTRQIPPPSLDKRLYVPSQVAAGAPFDGFLILTNRDQEQPYAIKPTARAQVEAVWSDRRREDIRLALPLVTSSVSVVPVSLMAPERPGDFELRLQSVDPLIGKTDTGAFVHVGGEQAREVVIPASVRLNGQLAFESRRGETIPVKLEWLPFNKINAYYSASVRLVKENGEKVTNVDRQPDVPTFLWQPGKSVPDEFSLTVPQDISEGTYDVELIMYQADTDQSVLLLGLANEPTPIVDLGRVIIR